MWEDEDFGVPALTAAINDDERMPYIPGQLGALGIFEEDGITTTSVEIEENSGELSIIEPTERGAPGNTVEDDERRSILFKVDHFEINDKLNADEVQGVRELGTQASPETILGRIERKQVDHARRFDLTLEHQRVGAVKGVIVSGKGRVLHNLFTAFDIEVPAAISLGLTGSKVGVASHIKKEVVYQVEDELDEAYGHIHAMCGRDFHDAMWAEKEVRETFLADNQGYQLRDGAPDVFTVGKITFERYRTGKKATAANGGGFFAANEARVFPVGVPDLFITRFAPADLEETVNTVGLPRYTNQYPMQNGKGRHLDSQMNAISLCRKPGVLRTLTI